MRAKPLSTFKNMLFISLIFLGACQSEVCVDLPKRSSTGTIGSLKASSISFAGIDYIDGVTDSTATIHWTHVSGASQYRIYSVSGSDLTFVGQALAPTTSYTVTGLTPSSSRTFKVRAEDINGDIVDDTAEASTTTNSAPDTPSGLSLLSPALSPAFDDTPTITVSGVKTGDTVKLFSDASCSTEIGSATASGATVNVTVSTPLAVNTYTFYANASGVNTSSCSSASVAYEKTTCPAGYIPVPANAAVGAPNDFCVMKYEAKNDGSNNPTSTEGTTPWVSISQVSAKSECQSLNALNSVTDKYDLISNPEWMAIARNVENVASNWTNGAVSSGCLKRGNNGSTDACLGGSSGYNGANPEFGAARNALASLTLDNGEVIWDLSGNVWEWVDWTLGGALSTNMAQASKPYITADGAPVNAWRELDTLFLDSNFTALVPVDSVMPTDTTYNSASGVGQYYAGTSGGAARRGGNWNDGTYAGAFALDLDFSSTGTYTNVGFRCVFRP